jgi:hypothetical protein
MMGGSNCEEVLGIHFAMRKSLINSGGALLAG